MKQIKPVTAINPLKPITPNFTVGEVPPHDGGISRSQVLAFEVHFDGRRTLPAMSVAELGIFLKALATLREITHDLNHHEGRGSLETVKV